MCDFVNLEIERNEAVENNRKQSIKVLKQLKNTLKQ